MANKSRKIVNNNDKNVLIMFFQHQAEELRFIKLLQWKIVNYTILLYAVIASLNKLIGINFNWYYFEIIMSFLIIGIMIMALILFHNNLKMIERRRNTFYDMINNKEVFGVELEK